MKSQTYNYSLKIINLGVVGALNSGIKNHEYLAKAEVYRLGDIFQENSLNEKFFILLIYAFLEELRNLDYNHGILMYSHMLGLYDKMSKTQRRIIWEVIKNKIQLESLKKKQIIYYYLYPENRYRVIGNSESFYKVGNTLYTINKSSGVIYSISIHMTEYERDYSY